MYEPFVYAGDLTLRTRQNLDKNPDIGTSPAKDAYVGSPFKVNRKYAECFGNEWVILSAK